MYILILRIRSDYAYYLQWKQNEKKKKTNLHPPFSASSVSVAFQVGFEAWMEVYLNNIFFHNL